MTKRFFEIISEQEDDDKNKWTWQPLALFIVILSVLTFFLR